MPVLVEERPTKVIELPKSKGKVVVKAFLNASEKEAIDNALMENVSIPINPETRQMGEAFIPMDKEVKSTDRMVELLVVDWDFTDKEGQKLEPTLENIKKVESSDYQHLVKELSVISNEALIDSSKKKST